MDKVLEKFGIYDFLGIWGPGALTVTYYVLTMHDCFSLTYRFIVETRSVLWYHQHIPTIDSNSKQR